jgi:hypothetical protein
MDNLRSAISEQTLLRKRKYDDFSWGRLEKKGLTALATCKYSQV